VTAVNPLAGSISFVVITENNVRDCDAILEVLSLGKHPIDDVIVLTRSDRVSEINTADRPWCRVIGISDASIYSLRAQIPTISQNDWLVVLEEHSLVTIAQMGEQSVVAVEPNVLLSSGLVQSTTKDGVVVPFRLTLALAKVGGQWLIAQHHAPPVPKT